MFQHLPVVEVCLMFICPEYCVVCTKCKLSLTYRVVHIRKKNNVQVTQTGTVSVNEIFYSVLYFYVLYLISARQTLRCNTKYLRYYKLMTYRETETKFEL